MFFPESRVRVWLYARATDMRKGFDGLAALAKHALGEEPTSGHLFVFVNRRRTHPGAMSSTVDAATLADLRAHNEALQQQVGKLKRQLEWFKRQLFGVRSERRWSGGEGTLDLFGGELPVADEAPSETITYRRRKSKDRGEPVTGEGLRFDASVPVEVIEVPAPELAGSGAHP